MAPLVYLGYLAWLAVVSGAASFLTYDSKGQELHFKCPPASGSYPLLHASVYRVPLHGGSSTLLARWDLERRGSSLHERVSVANTSTQDLTATLRHVSCHDSVAYTYTCSKLLDDNQEPVKETDSFKFIGETTQPFITQDPLKSRYEEGEQLSLNCTALVGTPDNGVIWEAGLPGGPFSPLVTGENPVSDEAYEEKQVARQHCNRESHFPLKYILRADDDGKIFQCRLRRTNQTTRIAVAVKTDEDNCSQDAQGVVEDSQTAGQETRVALQVTKLKSEQMDRGAETAAQSTPYIVIACLIAVVIVALSAFFVIRHVKKKPLQPLVVVAASTSSTSESSYIDRRLPDVPDPLPDTVPKWIAETHHRHLDNSLNNVQTDVASASVYVSMTAMDRCGKPEAGTPVSQEERAHAPAEAETEPGVEELVPDMRLDHSESVYSNQMATESESLIASTRVEELKGGEDDSVYIPSFIESI